MANVYAPPEGFESPNIDRSGDWQKQEQDYIEGLKNWCKEHGKGTSRGEVVRFPVGDGYAQYMVFSGSALIHLPLGDAYQIPEAHSRGLRAKDIAALIERGRRVKALFS